MRVQIVTALVSVNLLSIANAYANDSLARVGTGGIVLMKTKDIRMVQEVLEISTRSIRVKYQFRNETSSDIRSSVAFPLPSYGWNNRESAYAGNVRPLRNFRITVDETEVPSKLMRKAVYKGRDITEKLRKIGLTDYQIFEIYEETNADDPNCGITKKQEAKIAKAFGSVIGCQDWKVAETVYWEQIFPAGRTIEVRHEYEPFSGMTYGYPYQDRHRAEGNIPWAAASEDDSSSDKEACIDEGIRNAIAKRIDAHVKAGASWVQVVLRDVEYVLGTGRNWKGPIADFRLRIEKDSPDQIVSLCFPGKPIRLTPVVMEFTQKNFVPQDHLVVHFYTIRPTE